MKTFWKWFFTILLALVIVAGLGIGWTYLRHALFGTPALSAAGFGRDWGTPMISRMGPMHARGGMGGGLMMVGMGLRWLLPLALAGLVAWGVFTLGRRSARHPEAPAAPAPVAHPCPKCGAPVQDGWKHCPQCGRKQ